MEPWDTNGYELAHTPRFEIPMALCYRTPGETAWREGRVENISRAEVLFLAESTLELGTPLEMQFLIPVSRGARVVCRGRVARAAWARGVATMAATIESYRLERMEDADARTRVGKPEL